MLRTCCASPATCSCGRLAVPQARDRLVPAFVGPDALVGEKATRTALRAALSRPDAVFAMSHGRRDALLDQGGDVALDAEVLRQVAPGPAYVYACHSADSLGSIAATEGWTWIGYTGSVAAPGTGEAEHRTLAPLFRQVRATFTGALDGMTVWLETVRTAASDAQEQLDQLGDASFLAYGCALHAWHRLRAWRPACDAPDRHPLAGEPLLLL